MWSSDDVEYVEALKRKVADWDNHKAKNIIISVAISVGVFLMICMVMYVANRAFNENLPLLIPAELLAGMILGFVRVWYSCWRPDGLE